jgi:aryl-alcohol dehydrogenase-like predicted oxidoreductase
MQLGTTSIEIGPVAIGTWSWGDTEGWGFGQSHTEKDLLDVIQAAGKSGAEVLFDTAEGYGGGSSERYLGKCLRESGVRAVIATKFSPRRFEIRRKDLFDALRGSLQRLGIKRIDLYQIHWPTRFSSVRSRMAALADAAEDGLVRAVGISNFTREQILRSHDSLSRRNLPLASVQLEYSLLQRDPERNGILNLCKERNITFLAYSPLAMGVLSGKYSSQTRLSGLRGGRYSQSFLTSIQPLILLMKEIGENHGGKTVAQVSLNWVCRKGAVPIAGTKTGRQAEENLGATGWTLTENEMESLDAMSDRIMHRSE